MPQGKNKLAQDAFVAARKNEVDRLQRALDSGVSADERDEYGLTLLMWAARKNSEACAKRLLAQGADLDAVDRTRRNALHHAAAHNSVEVARLLIECGIDLRHRDEWGSSPLPLARSFGAKDAYLCIRAALVSRGLPLDESASIGKEWRIIGIDSDSPGVREDDLSQNEVAKIRGYSARPIWPKLED